MMDPLTSDKMETYHGYVRTPSDAIKLFEACRLGLLPRVQRRLSEKERQSIRSGSVFVWDEREAGMRRWTDGKSWSASRVSGSFLTYREMEGKRGGGFGSSRRTTGKTPDSGRGSDEDQDDGEPEGYRYKADGLMKQSFSITTSNGQHLHLISYYSRPQPGQPDLPQPSSDPALRGIVPVKGMYPESSMGETNQTPALTRAPMQHPPFMVAPQHGHGHPQAPYHPHYGHPYGWPMSPSATPPYHPYGPPPPYPPVGGSPYAQHPHYAAHGPPPPHHHPPPPHHHYTHHPQPPPPPGSYDHRVTLPPPHISKPAAIPAYQNGGPSPPRLHDSPRTDNLQAAAVQAAVMVDPHLNPTSARNPQGPLPPLGSSGAPAPGSTAAVTPPSRASVTPPRSAHSETPATANGNKASLSALLHPQPAIKTETDANNSPTMEEKTGVSEDARALRMLDRKFCI